MAKDKVFLYDTTLRDGSQSRSISFSLEDKLNILKKLDDMGFDYVEGGWPNPTHELDRLFFAEAAKMDLKHARPAAFGSTRRPDIKASEDGMLQALIDSKSPVITIFGKTWDLHVTKVIRTTLEENLAMITDSVAFLKKNCEEVMYDAEHFFDGWKNNRDYAMQTLEAAVKGGADWLILCDTNGGMMPDETAAITEDVVNNFDVKIGIHGHNDTACAVANSLVAVQSGVRQIQGTINGIGERCGNTDLIGVIPGLEFKYDYQTIGKEKMSGLVSLSRYVDEVANQHSDPRKPYVGAYAFAHKAGAHIDGVLKEPTSFEHMPPESVGNARSFVLSDQSGGSAIVSKIKKYYPDVDKKDPRIKNLLLKLKEMEADGYQFESAEGSFRLLVEKELGEYSEPFTCEGFRVYEEQTPSRTKELSAEATIKVIAKGEEFHTAAVGDGPVNAMDNAIRKALTNFYPQLSKMGLVDYKVLVINGAEGTGAKVRVIIESADEEESWGTVGVSTNIIEASWIALVDALNYKLLKDEIL
ncbi:MAG: citramalate synthase [Spirochaetales bacterium]|nr:citramalate synthase [Spirochaetales bacterium]